MAFCRKPRVETHLDSSCPSTLDGLHCGPVCINIHLAAAVSHEARAKLSATQDAVLNCHFSRDPVWTWPAPVLGIVLTGLSHVLSAQPCCPAALLPWSCRVSSVLHLVDSRPPLERAAYFVMCSASQTGNLQRIATSSTGNSLAWGLACFYSSTVQ